MQRTVLMANMSGDVYGSDLQLLESVRALLAQGWRVVVVLAQGGPLVERLHQCGAEVSEIDFPILSHADASARGVARLAARSPGALARISKVIRRIRPDVIYVNTVTLPWWLMAARLNRTPALCHVHEAEQADRPAVLKALYGPLLLADHVVCNGRASAAVACELVPKLRQKISVVYNGVSGPNYSACPPDGGSRPFRLVLVGRVSPRKAQHIALEAVSILRAGGRDVHLEVCGTPFKGYEWYSEELRNRAAEGDLIGHITWAGYVDPIWPALARAHVLVAPSQVESFGNVVVEAQLSMRPVVVSDNSGYRSIVQEGQTGLLVKQDDPQALAQGVARLMDDVDLAGRLARQGQASAMARFSTARYADDIVAVVEALAR